MKKTLVIITVLVLAAGIIFAQHKGRHERIRAIRVAYITDALELSPKQSEKFWPVYNVFLKEQREVRHKFMRKYRDMQPDADKVTTIKYINDNLDYQQEILTLKKEYKDKILETITPQQLAKLYKTEEEFKKMLIRRISHHKGKQHEKH